jgi:hypothetical protein
MSQRTCEFPGCQRKYYGRGLCDPHYQQRHKKGKELTPVRDVFVGTAEERFHHFTEVTDGCWNWTGNVSKHGYGVMRCKGLSSYMVHRYSYELLRGPIPQGLVLDHLCRNRRCVNPEHLEIVTSVENVMRGEGFAPKNAAKTHCDKGHEFTPENTYIRTRVQGGRECRACIRIKSARRYRKKKQQ